MQHVMLSSFDFVFAYDIAKVENQTVTCVTLSVLKIASLFL